MATNSTSTGGTISVPMSSILDALKGELNEAERAVLFQKLIGFRINEVAPGDLIRSALFNQMLGDINDLALRVAKLEAGTVEPAGPIIDYIDPQGVDLPAASKITIVGSNFRPNDEGTFISFGNVNTAIYFPESDQNHMIVPVPVNLQGLATDLPVSVTCNGRKSNAVVRHFVPQVIPVSGYALITYLGAAIGKINIGQTYSLVWRVLSQVTVEQTFDLSPTVIVQSGTANAAAWGAGIHLSVTGPITLKPSQYQDITMTVTVPANAGTADIGLRADSTTTPVNGVGAPLSLVVGAAPAVSDPRALLKAADSNSADLSKFTPAGEALAGFRVKPSKSNLALPMEVSTSAQGGGFYLFEVAVQPGTPSGGGGPQTGRWTPGAMPATRLQIAAPTTQHFDVPITSSGVVDTATLSHLLVTAKCYATNSSASPVFTSFVRVPITGKS